MAGFDIDLYDDAGAATRALSFVRNGLLFAGLGGGRFEWPVELDPVPELIAAELAGYEMPDAGRVYEMARGMACPAPREFIDLVMAGARCDEVFLETAIEGLVDHGSAGSGERDDATMRALRADPAALYAAAMVSDAMKAACEGGSDIHYVMPGSRAFAAIMLMGQERDTAPAITPGF